jgi:predicted MFS family arabinose efflux permease
MGKTSDEHGAGKSKPTYVQLVRENPDFRRIWLGESISFLGDWFTLIALYSAVQELTDSKLALAGILIGKTLPIFFMAPIAGPLIDRMDRRKLLIATDIARAVSVLGLIAAHQLESLPLLYAVLSIQICFSGIFTPARTAVLPQVARGAQLPVAMALSGGTWSVMLAFGAALGGVMTETVGIDGAFMLDGVTYLVSAVILWRLPPLPPTPSSGKEKRGFVAGLSYIRAQPWVLRLLAVKPALALQSAAFVMIPIFGNGTFPRYAGAVWVGILYSARGFGALLGSVGVRRFTGDTTRAMRIAIPVGLFCTAVSLAALAWAPTFWIATAVIFTAAIGTGTAWVFSGTLLQQATDDGFRGRVFAIDWGLLTVASAIGSGLAGVAGDLFAFDERQIVAAVALFLAAWALLWPLFSWRKAPE